MVRGIAVAVALVPALSMGGCVGLANRSGPVTTAAAPAGNPPGTWNTARRLSMMTPPQADDGEVVWGWVPGTGMVRATRQTMATIGRPLDARPGPNRTVEACRLVAWGEAAKLGARDIEAVSGGPQQTDRQGRVTAPVHMRITYAGLLGYEVREAVMTCSADRSGIIVDARM